ncbi:protein adenylyltransferase SelO-1, mitochondrial-like, partial [Saccoglossus kowalevskii]
MSMKLLFTDHEVFGRQWTTFSPKPLDLFVLIFGMKIPYWLKMIYKTNQSSTQKYLEFYREVVLSTARLVAEWQAVGFCHGVLNTDNMSILGLTIDYGPYGFMDRFDQDYICNGSDDGGRYAFNKQPSMCKWNLKKFAEALSGYTELDQVLPLEMSLTVLEEYEEEYQKCFLQKMRKKFGLVRKQLETDIDLVDSFLQAMQDTGGDYTNCFRCLNQLDLPGADTYHTSMERVTNMLMAQSCTLEELKNTCKPRMDPRELMMIVMLMQTNPDLLANLGKGQHMVVKEMEKVEKLKQLQGLTEQDKKNKDLKIWSAWLEKYSDRLRLECKDMQDIEELSKTRVTAMNSNNPKYILRNYIAHNAITCAEKGDFSEVRRVLKLLEHPYDDGTQVDDVTMQLEQHNIESSSSAEQ